MGIFQILLIAFRALLRNKLRSFLTTLGVIIGVGAVISMTSIGAGARERVNKTFEEMGSNMLVIRSGSSQSGGVHGGAGSQPTLTWKDLDAVKTEIRSIRYCAPVLGTSAQLMAEGQNWSSMVQGTVPDYFMIRNWPIGQGSFFNENDVNAGKKVAVVGKTVADNLFGPDSNPLGQIIRIKNMPFEIIGVASSKGQSAFGTDNDDVVFIPYTTFRTRIQGGLQQFLSGSIYVSAVSPEATKKAQNEITALLHVRHEIKAGMPDDFSIRNLADIASAQQEGAKTMTSLLAGIALVSLIVGGIGIMNIMLVSVTERTREIGLRMAVGAKPRNILMQFLIEAVTLSVLGGALGLGLGVGVGQYLVSKFGWPMLLQPQMMVVSVVFSGIVGIVFGLYPAYKASRLDPIEALRYE